MNYWSRHYGIRALSLNKIIRGDEKKFWKASQADSKKAMKKGRNPMFRPLSNGFGFISQGMLFLRLRWQAGLRPCLPL